MKQILLLSLIITVSFSGIAQVNYDESKVPDYNLPDLLKTQVGETVKSQKDWVTIRRPEILEMFEEYVYGCIPKDQVRVSFELNMDTPVLDGKARMKNVRMVFNSPVGELSADLLIFIPDPKNGPSPLFVGMNYYGNHTIYSSSRIPITKSWVGNNEGFHIENNTANDASRGVRINRWPVERIIDRGYGVATIYYGDIDPDFHDDFENGLHALLDYSIGENKLEQRSSISAWAYALSKTIDYFETDPDIDEEEIIVIGHSRLGKTALWAGATDQRFAMVVSNNSGCGGAALSMRQYGETVEAINTRFPHWFSKNYHAYNFRENELPVDQHMLIALMAPRPVYVASASEDQWADPKGELLSVVHAGSVYQLFGLPFVEQTELPDLDMPLWSGRTGYHYRKGKHDITLFDWNKYMNFADKHLKDGNE